MIAALRTCVFSIVKDPELSKQWVDDSIRWARKILREPGYARSEEAQKTSRSWRSAGSLLLRRIGSGMGT